VSGVSAHVCTSRVWLLLQHECGTEEQTLDHFVFQCPIHQPPHGFHGLIWMMRQSLACPKPAQTSGAAKQWFERTGSKDDDEAAFACVL